MVQFKWEGGRASWLVRRAIGDAMEQSAAKLQRRIKRNINRPYPPASRPYEYPRRRTGTLRASIFYNVNRRTLTAEVGVHDEAYYWIFLEEGTRFMRPRPFMQRSFNIMETTIRRDMVRAMKQALAGGTITTIKDQAGKAKDKAKKAVKQTMKKAKKSATKKFKAAKKRSKKKIAKLVKKAKKAATKATKRARKGIKRGLRKAAKSSLKKIKKGIKAAKKRVKKSIKAAKKRSAANKRKAAASAKKNAKQQARAAKAKAQQKKRSAASRKKTIKKVVRKAKQTGNLRINLPTGDALTRFLLREARKYQ